jgi:hypothetical protein
MGPKESLLILNKLSGGIRDLPWADGWPIFNQLSMMQGSSGFIDRLQGLAKAGDVQSAVEMVLGQMNRESPAARRYIAQAFGIPDRTALIYDELVIPSPPPRIEDNGLTNDTNDFLRDLLKNSRPTIPTTPAR